MYSNGNGQLLRSVVDDCGCGVCGDRNGLNAGNRIIHTGAKSGGELVTLFDS